jgi:hypothetical protein
MPVDAGSGLGRQSKSGSTPLNGLRERYIRGALDGRRSRLSCSFGHHQQKLSGEHDCLGPGARGCSVRGVRQKHGV